MFKRNQVDAAIGAVVERGSRKAPSEELRTSIKRLLNTDRSYDGDEPSGSGYAFYGDEPPGRGADVWYSPYEAFALLMGLQLMQHGWSQTFAVAVLRDVRSELEEAYKKIVQLDPERLFDQKAIAERARAGDPAFETVDPRFLVIIMQHGVERSRQNRPFKVSVQNNFTAAMRWVADETKGIGGGSTLFEITVPIFQLNEKLKRTAPRPRGRRG